MKKVLAILMFTFMTLGVSAQSKLNVPKLYASASMSVFSQAGKFEDKTSSTAEVGLTIDNTSVGIAVGSLSFFKGNLYGEVRVTPTIWSKGKFSVSGTIGAGTVFNTKQFLVEYGSAVNYAVTKNVSLSAGYGVFNLSGSSSAGNFPFFSSGLRFSF